MDIPASGAVCELLASLHALPNLRGIKLTINVLEPTRAETKVSLRPFGKLFRRLEGSLMELTKLQTVKLEMTESEGGKPGWYAAFIHKRGPRIFPHLHEKGILMCDC